MSPMVEPERAIWLAIAGQKALPLWRQHLVGHDT
jgi:hypothetical protein